MFVVIRTLHAMPATTLPIEAATLRWCGHTHKTERTAWACARRWAGALSVPLDRFAVVLEGLWSR